MSDLLVVTGIGGFIGFRIAELARERGMRVRGVDISDDALTRARAAGFEAVRGDVTDPDAMKSACEGARFVVHTAAIVGEDGAWDLYRRVNVGGTRTVIEAARDAGVKRVVHLSSVMVYGFHYPDHVTEDGPLDGENNPYCQTKIESEEAARSAASDGSIEVVIVRPGDVYGPGSIPWIVRPLAMMKRSLFVVPNGGRGILNHVYVDNLCDAIFLMLDKDVAGETFNVTDGEATTVLAFFSRISRWRKGLGWIPTLPIAILRPAISLLDRAARRLGLESPAHPSAIAFLARPHVYSIEKAKTRLGFAPKIGLDEGLVITRAWASRESLL